MKVFRAVVERKVVTMTARTSEDRSEKEFIFEMIYVSPNGIPGRGACKFWVRKGWIE